MKSVPFCAAFALLFASTALADLESYIAAPDDSYAYTVAKTVERDGLTITAIDLTSQTWQGITWKHWLTIIRPETVSNPHGVLLHIAGGNNGRPEPPVDSQEARILGQIARGTESVVAVLTQIPNQPLFDGRHEDAIIALTYDKYLKGEGEDWPLLLPMVKGAVRAMDTIQAVVKEQYGQEVTDFMVSGASKRGWTTWLSAAADPRVKAIAPIVIDVLNMGEQAPYQMKSYGAYSDEVEDYTELKIQERMSSDKGKELLSIVDPFSYRARLTLPKLIVNGANDPYWCVDSANLYFPALTGPKYLCYQANTGHDVNLDGIGTITQFYYNMLHGTSMPKVAWEATDTGAMTVTWEGTGGQATLWTATSANRDFRQSTWTPSTLQGNGRVVVTPPDAGDGYVAYYVQVKFPGNVQMPYGLSTQMTVLPDTYPFEGRLKTARTK